MFSSGKILWYFDNLPRFCAKKTKLHTHSPKFPKNSFFWVNISSARKECLLQIWQKVWPKVWNFLGQFPTFLKRNSEKSFLENFSGTIRLQFLHPTKVLERMLKIFWSNPKTFNIKKRLQKETFLKMFLWPGKKIFEEIADELPRIWELFLSSYRNNYEIQHPLKKSVTWKCSSGHVNFNFENPDKNFGQKYGKLSLNFHFISSCFVFHQNFYSDCSSGHALTTCLEFAPKICNWPLKARKEYNNRSFLEIFSRSIFLW